MMINPACHWVIARLPLGVSAVGEPIDRRAEGGDLDFEELRTVRRHLTGCASCRQYELSLRQATELLAAAAIHPPAPLNAVSLWPDLERRMAEQATFKPFAIGDKSTAPSGWIRFLSMARNWVLTENDERFHGAWLCDELQERFNSVFATALVSPRLRMSVVLVSGLAAIAVALWVGVPVLRDQEMAARAVIASNERAPAELAGPPVSGMAEVEDRAVPTADIEMPAHGQLAQAEPAKVVEPPLAAAEPVPVVKSPTPPPRFNFDLEHGRPMPPDSRDPKPVY